MTTSRIHHAHMCTLPAIQFGDYNSGDVIRCDDCGTYWQTTYRAGWEFGAEWYRISRLAGWWIARHARPAQPSKPSLCGRCERPFEEGEEWCPACTKCPEHGNFCEYGFSEYDCEIARGVRSDRGTP